MRVSESRELGWRSAGTFWKNWT